MKSTTSKLALLALFSASLMQAGTAHAWTATGGGDHGGMDWIPVNGTEIAGIHTNICKFKIPAGTTVTVKPYDGVNFGSLSVTAQSAEIAGRLSADGAGYGGGGGGGGGVGSTGHKDTFVVAQCPPDTDGCWLYSDGAAGKGARGGADGEKGTKNCLAQGTSVGGEGGKGGGTFGGDGGASVVSNSEPDPVDGPLPGNTGVSGGYNAAGTNGDATADESLRMGSGGGGGSGGASSYEHMHASVGGSGGGSAGGSGGGIIRISADYIKVPVGGAVTSKGTMGEEGKEGDNGYRGNPDIQCDLQGSGGAGGNASVFGTGVGAPGVLGHFKKDSYNKCLDLPCYFPPSAGLAGQLSALFDKPIMGGKGGDGGGGAGGGILLKANTVVVKGSVDARGGGDVVANGGTVKVSYCEQNIVAVAPTAGRYYPAKRADCLKNYNDIGIRIQETEGAPAARIAAELNPANSPLRFFAKEQVYGPSLMDVPVGANSCYSKLRIQTSTGVKAIRKFPD